MRTIFTYLFLLLSIFNYAQQIPVYSQNWLNPFLINPGFTGQTNSGLEANLIHRNQWKGIPGAPVTSVLSLDGKTSDKHIGLGLLIVDDKAGLFARRGIYTSYSYKFKIAGEHYVSPGINFGLQDVMVNFSGSNVRDNNDPFLFTSSRRKSSFDANFGAVYFWNELNAGIGIQQLFANKYRFANDTSAYYRTTRKFNIYGSYNICISKEYKINAKPIVLLNFTPKSPTQFDIMANFDYDNMLFAGLGYRFKNAISFNLGVRWNNAIRISYNYDLMVGKLSGYTGGSHEFVLGYSFNNLSKADTENKEFYPQAAKNDSLKNEAKNLTSEMERLRKELKAEKLNNLAEENHEDLIIHYANEYKNADGSDVTKGFYLVMGRYKLLQNAETDMKELAKQDIDAKIISHPSRGYTLFCEIIDTKEKALHDLKIIRWKRPVAYVLELQ